jgi:anti-sigma regulatory factor (Ser/Thr protein kinase)
MNTLTVAGNLESLGAIAQYVNAAARKAGLDKKTAYRLRTAVDEIATNIIMHGYPALGIQGEITLNTQIDEQTLTISIEDTGAAYDLTQHSQPVDLEKPLEERKIGGLGVYLAQEGVDRLLYQRTSDRNQNILVVNRMTNSHPRSSG